MKKWVICVWVAIAGAYLVPALACTTAIISAEASGTGRPMLWKHRDTDDVYNHIEHIKGEIYSFTALVNTKESCRDEVWGGANEAGFAIANNVSYNINVSDKDMASRNGSLMMQALSTCATVNDFEKFVLALDVPRALCANFAVIDAQGGAAYFEVGDERFFRFDVKDSPDGYLYRTNFSIAGCEDKGMGYIRYAAAEKIFEEKKTGFTPGWILTEAARSFYHGLMKTDLRDVSDESLGEGFIISLDYIPRPSSVSSIVIEGVNPGEDPSQTVIWSAIGYAPCSYAVPVWVGAGTEIPACLSSTGRETAPANALAVKLKNTVFPIKRGNGSRYLDYLTLRRDILPRILEAEAEEIADGERLKKKFAKEGFDIEDVRKYNKSADMRFDAFRAGMKQLKETQ